MNAATMAEKRATRKAAGLCTECDTPHLPNHSVCARHFEMRQHRLVEFNRQRKAKKLCYCGAPVKRGRDRCPTCLDIENRRQSIRYVERRDAGRCVVCGRHRPKPGRVTCKECAEDQHISYVRARDRRLRVAAAKLRRGQLLKVLSDGLMREIGV